MSKPDKQSPVQPRGRPTDEGRFIWLATSAVERIVSEMGTTQAAFGIAVYVALCRLSAQNQNTAEIHETISKIAGMARLSYRKTAAVLEALADQAKVLVIRSGQRTAGVGVQPPNAYVLLATRRHGVASGRRHNVPSSDGTRRRTSRAEIYKETPVGGIENNTAPLPASLPAAEAGAGGIKNEAATPPQWKGTF